jgi:hypothetical protein
MITKSKSPARRGARVMRRAAGAVILGAGLFALASLAACAEPPQKTIDATRAVFIDVRDGVQGAIWAPDEFSVAEATVREAEEELRRQQARWGFRRDYSTVLDLFRAAQSDLEAARLSAVAGRQLAEKEAREAVDAALASVDHARAAVLVAPVTRDGRMAGGRLDGGLDHAQERLEEARRLLGEEKFREALKVAEEVLEEVSTLMKAVGLSRRSGV